MDLNQANTNHLAGPFNILRINNGTINRTYRRREKTDGCLFYDDYILYSIMFISLPLQIFHNLINILY